MTQQEAAEKYAEPYRCPATNENEYCKHDIISAFNNGAKLQQEEQYKFAIEFADWCIKNNLVEYYVLSILYKTDYKYSIEELLETFKKEKKL